MAADTAINGVASLEVVMPDEACSGDRQTDSESSVY